MKATPNQLIQMELHMEQLIRMIAHLNERILELEHKFNVPSLSVVGK